LEIGLFRQRGEGPVEGGVQIRERLLSLERRLGHGDDQEVDFRGEGVSGAELNLQGHGALGCWGGEGSSRFRAANARDRRDTATRSGSAATTEPGRGAADARKSGLWRAAPRRAPLISARLAVTTRRRTRLLLGKRR